jgi:hypothetical protein
MFGRYIRSNESDVRGAAITEHVEEALISTTAVAAAAGGLAGIDGIVVVRWA